jgi:hypothetical protein
MVRRIVDQKMKKQEFIDHAKNQLDEFEYHVTRVKTQFEDVQKITYVKTMSSFKWTLRKTGLLKV